MEQPNLRAAYAKHVLHKHVLKAYNRLNGTHRATLPSYRRHNDLHAQPSQPDLGQQICVIGAGAAGLATTLFLQSVGFTNITVLEATDRVGGRAYTHTFTQGPPCPHNYYDAGAMRIPQIPTQASTLNLIEYLKVPKAKYLYKANGTPSLYQGYPTGVDSSGFDNYMTTLLSKVNILTATTQTQFDDAFMQFLNGPYQPDRFSTRAWLMLSANELSPAPLYTYDQTEMAETFDTSTGLFDQAFMETICDFYDFNAASNQPWFRIEGGMSQLTNAMSARVAANGANIVTNCAVTALSTLQDEIKIQYSSTSAAHPPTDYAAVFNTTTMGCLRQMDLSGLITPSDGSEGLQPEHLVGIRSLSYDRSTKVAVKFRTPWWSNVVNMGGVSSSDLNISNVVYPSWNDGPEVAHTIIVSYSWAQDASRMGALIAANDVESTDVDDPLVQLCFRDLATLWARADESVTVEFLMASHTAHHAMTWSHTPWTSGAFALFGPGQFEFLYPLFTKPLCGNKLTICGEAVSGHHAWISGALDSAYIAVYAWCLANGWYEQAAALTAGPFGNGVGQDAAELDRNVLEWHLHCAKLERERRGAKP